MFEAAQNPGKNREVRTEFFTQKETTGLLLRHAHA